MIYTFYSFKGGVGRSMALANLGENFHMRGLRVVMIDWDLEAPGLETYFYSRDLDLDKLVSARARRGLLDLLLDYRKAFPRIAPRIQSAGIAPAAIATDLSQYAEALEQVKQLLAGRKDIPDALQQIPAIDAPRASLAELLRQEVYRDDGAVPREEGFPGTLATSPLRAYLQCIHPPDQGVANGLYLMSAGAREGVQFGTYASAVQDFDWAEFYAAFEGRQYFSWLRDSLRDIADIVLIDSRTGVTEMGGVCTRHMPDAVVSFCAPNNQNVDGVMRIVAGINRSDVKEAREDRYIELMVIPTRIDNSESDRLAEFSKVFADSVEREDVVPEQLRDAQRPLWNLQIPYIPRYNYREERVVGRGLAPPDPATEKLIESYGRIALSLAVLAPPESRIRECYAGEIGTAFPLLHGGVLQMAPPVPESWVERPAEVGRLKQQLLEGANTAHVSRISVWGPAGTGKTTLLARVCRDPEIVRAFPDGILWLAADKPWTADVAQAWLRARLGLGRNIGERSLLELFKERRFLIVADDVWDAADVDELFKYGGRCAQIMVTRDLGVASRGGATVVPVGLMREEEGRALLKSSSDASLAKPGDANYEIAQRMLTWPLGVSLVRTALERLLAQSQTPAMAWQELRQAFIRHRIVAFDQPGAIDRNSSVATSLRHTISRLTVDQKQALLGIARNSSEGRAPSAEGGTSVDRLKELALVTTDDQSGRVRIDALVEAFLLAQGELDQTLAVASGKARVSSSVNQKGNTDVELAKAILQGQAAAAGDILSLADRLKDARYFGYARRLLLLARRRADFPKLPEDVRLKMAQRHALCTYKDPDFPADLRFTDALAILVEADLLLPTPSQETLGLAGAIHKYRWKLNGGRGDLERSLGYYLRGYRQGIDRDFGYTAINAAFVLDLIAGQQRADGDRQPATASDDAMRHAESARKIREEIATTLPPMMQQKPYAWLKGEWWFYSTLAEACFGLGRHDEARYWLREGLALAPPDWQLESTTRQFVDLAHAQGQTLDRDKDVWRTLRILVGDAEPALRAITQGKVGLALSGGGFRASLFHIGVLARLAELDVLRHVEVLSCVSGGSIIGAHYYLEVRRLLRDTADRAITRADYIAIVRRLEADFLGAVQRNLRTRLLSSIAANLKTLFNPHYTRTDYLGELFEEEIYAKVPDGEGKVRWLDSLYIKPTGDDTFNPKLDNWRRGAKAPILLLNATTLNTGHTWQFAVSWMGEPPLGASSPVDRNDVLRRMYYWEAPHAHQRIRLGRAVAASATVPALFDPVEFDGLFPNHLVRLVDGGVHDNQGIGGLIEQECTVMLVSDASGQMDTQDRPSGDLAGVGLRSNGILQARVREAQFREVDALRRSSALRGLMFLHLKKDLDANQLDWVECQDPFEPPDDRRRVLTRYGIPRTLQKLLAAIRTDLDSFSDREAYSLMLSGYRMTDLEFREQFAHWQGVADERESWRFQSVEAAATRAPGHELEHANLLGLLRVSGNLGGKVWRLSRALRVFGIAAVAAMVVAASWFVLSLAPLDRLALFFLGAVGVAGSLLVFAVTFATLWLLHRISGTGKSRTVIATGLLMVPFGALAAKAHLAWFDRVFLQIGAIQAPASGIRAYWRPLAAALVSVLVGGTLLVSVRSLSTGRVPAPSATVETPTDLARARQAQASRDYTNAIALWTTVLATKPTDVEALAARAYARLQRGDLQGAAADYSTALQGRQDPALLRGRAYVYKLLDRLDDSRRDLEAVLRIERDDLTIQDLRYLEYLQRPRLPDTRPPARLYVQVADPVQEVGLDRVRQSLGASVLVRPPTLVPAVPAETELRYTHPEDAGEAARMVKQLRTLGLRVADPKQVGGDRGRPRHFELWLSKAAGTLQ